MVAKGSADLHCYRLSDFRLLDFCANDLLNGPLGHRAMLWNEISSIEVRVERIGSHKVNNLTVTLEAFRMLITTDVVSQIRQPA